MTLISKIEVLNDLNALTKQEKIVNGIIESIRDQTLNQGDMLPSVNELSNKLGFSRETVVKAYQNLKEKGIVASKHGLGFFISGSVLDQKLRIAIVLYGFQSFQQDFYNAFRKELGPQYHLDVYFHHNNLQMYRSILSSIRLKYGKYVIAPIQNEEAKNSLSGFPDDKLLIIDRYQELGDGVSYISQEFEMSLSIVFEKLEKRILEFKHWVLFYRDDVDYPEGIYKSFMSFCKSHHIQPKIYKEFEDLKLEENHFYFTVGDADLWLLLKQAKQQDLKLGKDIGILSHNDSPVKEIISGGITTFSTDFKLMGRKAAKSIKDIDQIKEITPCLLIRRNSL